MVREKDQEATGTKRGDRERKWGGNTDDKGTRGEGLASGGVRGDTKKEPYRARKEVLGALGRKRRRKHTYIKR